MQNLILFQIFFSFKNIVGHFLMILPEGGASAVVC